MDGRGARDGRKFRLFYLHSSFQSRGNASGKTRDENVVIVIISNFKLLVISFLAGKTL